MGRQAVSAALADEPAGTSPSSRSQQAEVVERWNVKASYIAEPLLTASADGVLPGVSARQVATILTNAEGDAVFRRESRKPADQAAAAAGAGGDASTGIRTEVHTFLAPVRVLFWKTWSRTTTRTTIDHSQGPSRVVVSFVLVKADVFSRFEGRWELQDVMSDDGRRVVGTRMTFEQQLWPKGMPSALRLVPGIVSIVTDVVVREAANVLQKVEFVASKMGDNGCVMSALRQASMDVQRAGSFKKHLVASGGSFGSAGSLQAEGSDLIAAGLDTGAGVAQGPASAAAHVKVAGAAGKAAAGAVAAGC